MSSQIVAGIVEEFPKDADAQETKARCILDDDESIGDPVSRIEAALEVFLEQLRKEESGEMYSKAILFLRDVWNSWPHSRTESGEARSAQESVDDERAFERVLYRQMTYLLEAALNRCDVTEEAVIAAVEAARSLKEETELIGLLENVAKRFPQFERVAVEWMRELATASSAWNSDDAGQIETTVLEFLESGKRTAKTWIAAIDVLRSQRRPITSIVDLHVARALTTSNLEAEETNEVSCLLLHHLECAFLERSVCF